MDYTSYGILTAAPREWHAHETTHSERRGQKNKLKKQKQPESRVKVVTERLIVREHCRVDATKLKADTKEQVGALQLPDSDSLLLTSAKSLISQSETSGQIQVLPAWPILELGVAIACTRASTSLAYIWGALGWGRRNGTSASYSSSLDRFSRFLKQILASQAPFTGVQYKDHSSAITAIKAMRKNPEWVGLRAWLGPARTRKEREQKSATCIWFENFDIDYTDVEILKIFQVFGSAVSYKGKIDVLGRKGRYGFVEFPTKKQARDALRGMRQQYEKVNLKLQALPKKFKPFRETGPLKGGEGKRLSCNVDVKEVEDWGTCGFWVGGAQANSISALVLSHNLSYSNNHQTKGDTAEYLLDPSPQEKATEAEMNFKKQANLKSEDTRHVARIQASCDRDSSIGENFTLLYAKHLGAEQTKENVYKVFEPFGPVSIADAGTGAKRTVCWVDYKKHTSAAAALESMQKQGANLASGRLHVERARSKTERANERQEREKERQEGEEKQQTTCVWFETTNHRTTDTGIFGMVKAHCPFISFYSKKDDIHGGTCGFVEFATFSEAMTAWQGMHSRSKKVKFRFCNRPKEFELVGMTDLTKKVKVKKTSLNLDKMTSPKGGKGLRDS